MVIDTSALLAIVWHEPEREVFLDIILSTWDQAVSAVSYFEASILIATRKRNVLAVTLLDDMMLELQPAVVQVDSEMVLAARSAYFRFGKGFHPARLNFADCFSYTLSKQRNEPLLFKGNDFSQTDIIAAWHP